MRQRVIIVLLAVLLLAVVTVTVLYVYGGDEEAAAWGTTGRVLSGIGAAVSNVTDKTMQVSATYRERRANAAQAIERYRGALPFGTMMAICEHESVLTFNPKSVNPNEVIRRDGVSIGHARGLWQIMDGYQADYGVNAETVYDVDASTRGACRVRLASHESILRLAPELLDSLYDYTYVLYLAHFAGRGGMEKQLRKAIAAGGGVSAATVGGYGSEAGLRVAAKRAEHWEAQRAELTGVAA